MRTMPENTAQEARFDHVSKSGELVFAAGNLRFAVAVDDTLERAILAARQLRSEQAQLRQPATTPTLPISQIQTLIRAGAEPRMVAQRYGLDEALVRRFSAPVQTERQYAIEQFLSVPAPKESRVRTVADLIDRTLVMAGIRRDNVKWNATRRGHEPWHITALFDAAGRQIQGEWSWNMRDNAVTCLNATAKKLLGEQNLGASRSEAMPVPSMIQPGAFGEGFAIPLATQPAPDRSPGGHSSARPSAPATATEDGSAGTSSPTASDSAATPAAPDHAVSDSSHSESAASAVHTAGKAPAGSTGTGAAAVPAADTSDKSGEAATSADEAATVAMPAQPAPAHREGERRPRRRTGRSAVPSWDEILFGE